MSRTPSFRSMVHVHIMCSDTALLIQKLNQKGILLHNIHSIDYLTIALTVYQSDLEKIADVVERMDGKMLIHRNWGINWYFIRFLERKILLIGILLTILLTLLLPERLLILEVEGNQSVASAENPGSGQIMRHSLRCFAPVNSKRASKKPFVAANSSIAVGWGEYLRVQSCHFRKRARSGRCTRTAGKRCLQHRRCP